MVHSYSLIHDDLPAMDNDDLRRGRLTCHRAYDEATAILAGDGLLTLAFEILAREIKSESAALQCVSILAAAAGPRGMVGGQMADVHGEFGNDDGNCIDELETSPAITEPLLTLEAIHRSKTGALLDASLRIGAVIAGAPKVSIDALDCYGQSIGLAYQIIDDLLDLNGEESKLGKRVGKDSDLGKWTYPRFLGVESSRRLARELVEEAVRAIDLFGVLGGKLRCLAFALLERDR